MGDKCVSSGLVFCEGQKGSEGLANWGDNQCSFQFLIMLRGKTRQADALNHNFTEQKLFNVLQRAVSK